jgi:hypothetical protein
MVFRDFREEEEGFRRDGHCSLNPENIKKKKKSDSYFFKSNQKEEVNLFAATASASSRFSNLPLTEPEEAVIIFVSIVSPKKFKK